MFFKILSDCIPPSPYTTLTVEFHQDKLTAGTKSSKLQWLNQLLIHIVVQHGELLLLAVAQGSRILSSSVAIFKFSPQDPLEGGEYRESTQHLNVWSSCWTHSIVRTRKCCSAVSLGRGSGFGEHLVSFCHTTAE